MSTIEIIEPESFEPETVTSAEAERWLEDLHRHEKAIEFHKMQVTFLQERAEVVKGYLHDWAQHVRSTQGLKTIELPSATLSTRAKQETVTVTDKEEFEKWATDNGFVKQVADTSAAKKALSWKDDESGTFKIAFVEATGEVVEGIEKIVPADDEITLSIKRRS